MEADPASKAKLPPAGYINSASEFVSGNKAPPPPVPVNEEAETTRPAPSDPRTGDGGAAAILVVGAHNVWRPAPRPGAGPAQGAEC